MYKESDFTLTLLIDCSSDGLVDNIKDKFGNENVSISSNFIGGVSVAVFLVASIKSLQPIIKTILDFLSQRNDRYDDARIVYDGNKIDLKGYSPEDVEKILNNSTFDKLRQ